MKWLLVTVLVFVLMLGTIYIARTIIIIFAFSILFARLINPVVRFLQRHSLFFKNLKGPHVVEVYLAFLILAALIIHGLAPELHRNPRRFLNQIPAIADRVSTGEIGLCICYRTLGTERNTCRTIELFHCSAS
jgi:predicted PurR-regulated permease PerM